jgi:hypothetical protein
VSFREVASIQASLVSKRKSLQNNFNICDFRKDPKISIADGEAAIHASVPAPDRYNAVDVTKYKSKS